MMDIFSKLPNPATLMRDVTNENELKEKLKVLYKNEADGRLAYKMLSYIFATNKSTIRKLKPEEYVEFE